MTENIFCGTYFHFKKTKVTMTKITTAKMTTTKTTTTRWLQQKQPKQKCHLKQPWQRQPQPIFFFSEYVYIFIYIFLTFFYKWYYPINSRWYVFFLINIQDFFMYHSSSIFHSHNIKGSFYMRWNVNKRIIKQLDNIWNTIISKNY